MKVFYKREPNRSVLFVSGNQSLFIQSSSNSDQFQIKFKPIDRIKSLDQYRQLSTNYYGILGLIKVDGYVFIVVIEDEIQVASPRPNEHVYQLKKVDFLCLNSSEFDHYDNIENHPCAKLYKVFGSGKFYYAKNFDLTSTLQQRDLRLDNYHQMYENFDQRYVYNIGMIEELLNFRTRMSINEQKSFDEALFMTILIRGNIKTMNTVINTDRNCLITLISKISNDIVNNNDDNDDDEGKILNTIETEFIYYDENNVISYVQAMGNIPLIEFETKKKHKSVDIDEVSIDRHLDSLIAKYGNVVMLNFIKHKHTDEELINKLELFLNQKNVINFDISKDLVIKSKNKIFDMLKNSLIEIGTFVYDIKRKIYVGNQLGVFKVNLTKFSSALKYGNSILEFINKEVLEKTLLQLESFDLVDLFAKHELIWDENYLKLSEFFNRYGYSKELKEVQNIVSTPGQFKLIDPIRDYISKKLSTAQLNYSKQISLFTGSFNCNGESPQGDISSWLFPDGPNSKIYDIVAIALQEVIELTTNNLVIVDSSKMKSWEHGISSTLNTRAPYKCLSSVQLGGIVLMLFSKVDQKDYIKNVEKTVKKTGFGGMSSNKGAVCINFSYASMKICLVSSHLSAGLENGKQRQNDYKSIIKKVQYGSNRVKKDIDLMIWMGDFNYRIDLDNDLVRKAIPLKSFDILIKKDQLIKQMENGESFQYFEEMDIKFPPTYKFDKGTSTYDTGDKRRVPAWTDRILTRKFTPVKFKQLKYDYVPGIKFSDHRPIYGGFELEVKMIDELKKDKFIKDFLAKGDEVIINELENSDDSNKLAPPSNDSGNKWWINKNNGKIKIENLVIPVGFNPSLKPNPF